MGLTTVVYNYFLPKKTYETVFFFGNDQQLCDFHSAGRKTTTNKNNIECSACKLDVLIGWIDEAKKTLDICMYMFNCNIFSDALARAHNRGVCVRLIVNEDFVKTTWKLGCIGISKKVLGNSSNENLMHHKFVIIDNKKIILGSLNWTLMALRKNWENVFITNNLKIIDPFRQEFERLWAVFA